MKKCDLKPNSIFTTDGTDIWKLQDYFLSPSCTLQNPITGEKKTFGMGGITASSFHRVEVETFSKK